MATPRPGHRRRSGGASTVPSRLWKGPRSHPRAPQPSRSWPACCGYRMRPEMQVPDVDAAAARRMFASLPTMAVATLAPDGSPHVVPLWFVWPEDAVYLSVRREGRTWANAGADPRGAVTVEGGRSGVQRPGHRGT